MKRLKDSMLFASCLLIVGLVFSATGFAQDPQGGGMMGGAMMDGGMMGGGMMGMMIACVLFGVLLLVALVLGILALIKYLRSDHRHRP
ncbi:MAG: hypothetical protein H0W24_09275 [Lysobacter sp.]|nr:hypothetical protein [Lysobacter sp.]MDQ3270437.1 hypothetical protein [Pseudomonadota bacterium]